MAKEEIKIGAPSPEFSLKDEKESAVRLSDFKGRWVVFYFYPKDNTPGCTIEANAFTKFLREFTKLNAVILGVSPDSCGSHVKFIGDQGLKVKLLSDPDHKVLETYGAWQLKQNYGKKYWGVVRSTVLIDPDGNVAYHWKTVRADAHAEAVLEKLKKFLRQEKLARN